MLRSKFLATVLLTALLLGSCEKKVEIPCKEISSKYRIPVGYLYEDNYQKEFIVEHELYFFVLENRDTVMAGNYEFENKEIGDCYELPTKE